MAAKLEAGIRLRKSDLLAARTALVYLLVSSAWILFTDEAISAVVRSPDVVLRFQQFKGAGFVLVCSVILYFHLRGLLSRQFEAYRVRDEAQNEIIKRLSIASEWRDDETGDHVRRVSQFASVIAKNYGLSQEECDRIEVAAKMHDLGKIGVPDDIVMFDGAFNDDQRRKMQHHTIIGAQILAGCGSPLMTTAYRIALSHHERYDGKGYPYKLTGQDIPLEARITAIADVFDALLSPRRYKSAWGWDEAVAEIVRSAGTQFDPRAVAAFESGLPELRAIFELYKPAAEVEVGKRFKLAA